MLTAAMILMVLLDMSPGIGDEDASDAERVQFLAPVAAVILEVANETSNPIRTAAILLALGKNETRFARYVLEGRCEDGPPKERCDWNRRRGRPVARGPFQVHPWCTAAWSAPETSTESLVGGARCALTLVDRALHRCRRTKHEAWPGAFAVYRGQSCGDGSRTDGPNFKGRRYTRTLFAMERRLRADGRALEAAKEACQGAKACLESLFEGQVRGEVAAEGSRAPMGS